MFGSGERLTAAIVAFGKDGKHKVKPTIREGALRVLYGARAGAVMQFLDAMVRSLDAWAATNAGLDQWAPPLSGFILGPRHEARAKDIDGLIDQGVMMTASLGLLRATNSAEASPELAADVWTEEIRAEIDRGQTPIRGEFNRRVNIGGEHRIRIGFFSETYAAQFGVLRSDPTRVTRDVMLLKSRIVDLSQLQGDLFEYTENRHLIIGHRVLNDQGIKPKEALRLQNKLDLIEREADTLNIRVRAVTTAVQAAELIRSHQRIAA